MDKLKKDMSESGRNRVDYMLYFAAIINGDLAKKLNIAKSFGKVTKIMNCKGKMLWKQTNSGGICQSI